MDRKPNLSSLRLGHLELAFRSRGKVEKPALILLHGWPHSSVIYENVLDELALHSYVVAFDLPAIGDSRGAPSSSEKHVLADIILSAAESLGAKSIVIAGFDVGGMIAFAAARDHADRIAGAVVGNTVIPGIDPWDKVIADPRIWHFAFHNVPNLPETLVTGHERAYFDFFFDFLAKEKTSLSETLRNQLTHAYQRPEALTAGFNWYRAFHADAAHNNQPKRVDTPLLYLRGDADARDINSYAAGLRAAGIQNLKCQAIENCGEYLPVEAPRAFCKALLDFRQQLTAPGHHQG